MSDDPGAVEATLLPAREDERGDADDDALARADDDPPVVARLVIEIRSDGTRTVARGAMEDALAGQRVAIEARGGTPTELTVSLAGSIFQSLAAIPKMSFRAARDAAADPAPARRPEGSLRARVEARLRRAARRLGLP